jgi:probable HAF family extracellular repeat protein
MTTSAQATQYVVTDLGVAGAENTLGWGINDRGQVTGYAGTAGEDTITAFVWNPTTPNSLTGTLNRFGSLGGYFNWGIGINAGGQVAGLSSTTDDESEHATLWNPTSPNGSVGTLYDLGTLGGTYSQGTGINDGGQVTGYADLTGNVESHAIMWKPMTPGSASGTLHDLGSLGGSVSFGWDINASGQVAGQSYKEDDETEHAFLWNPTIANGVTGMMHDLGTLGGSWSVAEGINNIGQLAGSSKNVDENPHAFLWTPTVPNGVNGSMLDLGTLGGSESYGGAVSIDGKLVGTSAVPIEVSTYYHAFIYTSASGMVDLNTLIDPLAGWELESASDINSAGQITGQGIINGEYHAFLLSPVPLGGDFNSDGTVDAADYVTWRNGIPVATTQENYDLWRTHFGQTAGVGSALPSAESLSAEVPEPSSALLLLAIGVKVVFFRRGRAVALHTIA